MEAKIVAMVQEGKEVETLSKGMNGGIVLEHTPFYAESGGQVGDKGILSGPEFKFRVDDTQKRDKPSYIMVKWLKGVRK